MTAHNPTNTGDPFAARAARGNVANLQGIAAVARWDNPADGPASAVADLSNVIAFARARRGDSSAPPVVIMAQDRPAPSLPGGRRWLHGVLILCSLIVHGGAFYALWQEPKPLGTGIEAVTVDIVIGDNRPAGTESSSSADQVESRQVESRQVDDVKPDEKVVEETRPTDAREVKPEETRTDMAKEQPAAQPKEPQKELPTEQPPERQVVAMVETPQAEMPTVLPRETPPSAQATLAVRREQPKAARPPEPKRKTARPSEAKAVAGGSGRTAVASLANYNGQVSAHLRRYQQYPAAARSSGAAGSGTVTFWITGSGSVTSARIAKGTDAAVLDQEILAMVRRASPFPAPPDGQPKSFTVPLNFNLQQ
jgi:protein TonB